MKKRLILSLSILLLVVFISGCTDDNPQQPPTNSGYQATPNTGGSSGGSSGVHECHMCLATGKCKACEGTGIYSVDGSVCAFCNGSGICSDCGGSGYTDKVQPEVGQPMQDYYNQKYQEAKDDYDRIQQKRADSFADSFNYSG